ncbi:hypothetical protein [Sphingomonas sp. SAFR-052]|uniref:hypothetical protein n=1 Tax=Sphingomonas sp. SAFR-052 TaxID=3436867 RepID=UPI003F7DD59B
MAKARLVLVHGRAQQGKSEGALIEEWMTPLREALGARAACLDDVEVRAPFYGDRLMELLAQLNDPEPGDIIVRGPELYNADADYRAFVGDILEQVRTQEGVSEEQVVAEAGVAALERGPQNWPWVLAIIRALDKIPGIDGDMIERILRDVWIYLERRTVRKEIDAIVAPAFDTGLPVVCIAHSLGTVVAYHILRDRAHGAVAHLTTVGSPLGLKICRKALAPIAHPKVVGSWHNARDRRDVVALYPLDASHFPIDPVVANYDGVWNRTPNAHGIGGYVNDARVLDVLHRALVAL